MKHAGIESLRFIAILAIITIHVYPVNSLTGGILNQAARFAVPYFFIISGYLFYNKLKSLPDNDFSYFFRYGLRISYIYIFWYVIYIYFPLVSPDNWKNVLQNGFFNEFNKESARFISEFKDHVIYYLLAGGRADHLWFLPSLGMGIALLFISIRLNVINLGLALAISMFVMALLTGPYNKSFIGMPIHLDGRNGPFFSSIFVFIGAIIARYNIKTSQRLSVLLLVVGLLFSLIEAYTLSYLYDLPIKSINFVVSTLLFGSAVAFCALSFKTFGAKIKLDKIGGMTLGIYACHLLIVNILYSTGAMPVLGVYKVALVACLSIILVSLLRKIPYIRKVV
jgi:surface polysaccharide O-acyltransferase-like enzyme